MQTSVETAAGTTEHRSEATVGVALNLIGIGSTQFGAALAAELFSRVGPVGAVSLRLVGAAVGLTIVTRPWRVPWTRADVAASALFGAVFTLMNVALYLAIDRLPLATVITIEFLGPLGVALATATGWRARVWAAPAAAGVVLLGGGLATNDAAGVELALLAAGCWATYILLSRRLGRTGRGLPGLTLACAFGALVMIPIGAASAGTALVVPTTAAAGLGVGVLSSAIPYGLDVLVLRRLPTAVFGVLTSLNPAAAALAGFLVLHERLPGSHVVGIALVVGASVGITVYESRRRRGAGVREPVLR